MDRVIGVICASLGRAAWLGVALVVVACARAPVAQPIPFVVAPATPVAMVATPAADLPTPLATEVAPAAVSTSGPSVSVDLAANLLS